LPSAKLSRLEFQIMETLWRGDTSIREIHDSFPGRRKPTYATIQTTIYRMERKGTVRRVGKVGNFHVFSASVGRDAAQRHLIDDLLALFGGRSQTLVAHLAESGKLSLEEVKEAERTLRKMSAKNRE
jgi:predicted transcriptional regulator